MMYDFSKCYERIDDQVRGILVGMVGDDDNPGVAIQTVGGMLIVSEKIFRDHWRRA